MSILGHAGAEIHAERQDAINLAAVYVTHVKARAPSVREGLRYVYLRLNRREKTFMAA